MGIKKFVIHARYNLFRMKPQTDAYLSENNDVVPQKKNTKILRIWKLVRFANEHPEMTEYEVVWHFYGRGTLSNKEVLFIGKSIAKRRLEPVRNAQPC